MHVHQHPKAIQRRWLMLSGSIRAHALPDVVVQPARFTHATLPGWGLTKQNRSNNSIVFILYVSSIDQGARCNTF